MNIYRQFWCLLIVGVITLLGLIITIFKVDIVRYCMKPDADGDSKSVTIQVPFSIAVANKMFQILPRAAFFDSRNRGSHSNTIVVLAHMNKSMLTKPVCNNMVIACKVGDYVITSLEVKSLRINGWIHKAHPECTHDDTLILCYDIPTSAIGELNNSVVSVVYINPENRSEHIAVESEHSLFIPKNKRTSQSSTTVMACTTVFGTPPHFGAWIRYQKTLGVDLVHVNAHESFLSSSSSNDSDFLEYLQNGFVILSVWKEYLPPGASFYHSQALYYQYCLYRYLGVHDYCVCADTDDFLVPIDDSDFSVHNLVKKIFRPKFLQFPAGSCSLEWIRYVEPVDGFDPPEKSIRSGNLTHYLDTSYGEHDGKRTKTIYKVSAMLQYGIHGPSAEFLPYQHFRQRSIRRNEGYMAHIKKTRLKGNKLGVIISISLAVLIIIIILLLMLYSLQS